MGRWVTRCSEALIGTWIGSPAEIAANRLQSAAIRAAVFESLMRRNSTIHAGFGPPVAWLMAL
jgi:hypothetical protein